MTTKGAVFKMTGSKRRLSPAAPGHPARRQRAETQLRLGDLVEHNAIRPDDVLRCHKRYAAGHNINVLVDARVVVCAEVQNPPYSTGSKTVKVEILEDGRRNPLGSFTGPKGILEALVCRIGGLPTSTYVRVPYPAWDEFEVFRNGISLGTATHVRQQYHAGIQNREQTVARPANAANVTPTVFQTPALGESTHNMKVSSSPENSLANNNSAISETSSPLGQLNLVASNALGIMDWTPSTTDAAPIQPPQTTMTLSTTSPAIMQPPPIVLTQKARVKLTKKNNTKKSNDNSERQLQDTLMQELYAEIPAKFQPKSYNQKHTAITAKDCIKFQQKRILEVYQLIVLMGATPQSLLDMVAKLDEGATPGEAMRQGLAWSEKGPTVPGDSDDDEDDEDDEGEDDEDDEGEDAEDVEDEDAEDGEEAEGAEDVGAEPAEK